MDLVTPLSLGRVAIGALALTRPTAASALLGADAAGNPQLPFMTRLFGVREIALGAVTLLATGTARRDLVATGALVDLGDAVATVVSYRTGEVSPRGAAPLFVVALGAAVAGATEAAAARRPG